MFIEARIASFTKGDKRGFTKDYRRIRNRTSYLRRNVDALRAQGLADSPKITSMLEEIGRLKAERATVPASDALDPNYRRLRYCRYADDFLIGVTGSKADARQLMDEVRVFLTDTLKLEMSAEKSGIRISMVVPPKLKKGRDCRRPRQTQSQRPKGSAPDAIASCA